MTHDNFIHKIDRSAIVTLIGIILLFSTAVAVTLLAPQHIDPSWTEPTNPYQVQIYEIVDPNLYISNSTQDSSIRQFVYHIRKNYTLLSFQETSSLRIVAPPDLEKYITKSSDSQLKLTSELLLLRKPISNTGEGEFDGVTAAENLRIQEKKIQKDEQNDVNHFEFEILELFSLKGDEAFALAPSDNFLENWVDDKYVILDNNPKQPYHSDPGVVFVTNPQEYRISPYRWKNDEGWRYDPYGTNIQSLKELKSHPLNFISRQELITMGEKIYAVEGCWYCHTDQTRTLVQDVVLNGSDSYPAPPSSANEYIYQKITFPGTRRIGPDISRVGVKRPSRDWHKAHFWSPQTASLGSIMPPFQHFFDADPRGTGKNVIGIPNYKFEAIFQYLMTKGTRITPPTEAWWLGKDPIKTIEIIEGRRVLP